MTLKFTDWTIYMPYDLQISALLDLQQEFHIPAFPRPQSPSVISRFRFDVRKELHSLWSIQIHNTFQTFKSHIRCPRCGQSPLTETAPERYTVSLVNMNHDMPRTALEMLWELGAEMEKADLTILRKENLEGFVKGFEQIELVCWEGDLASSECGLLAWNGGRPEVPLGN